METHDCAGLAVRKDRHWRMVDRAIARDKAAEAVKVELSARIREEQVVAADSKEALAKAMVRTLVNAVMCVWLPLTCAIWRLQVFTFVCCMWCAVWRRTDVQAIWGRRGGVEEANGRHM